MVFCRSVVFQQGRDENALLGGGQGLAIGLQGAGADGTGTDLLLHRHFAQVLQAWVA
ncbi:hypothetical protein D3C78_1246330 [compost metagenome]